METGFMNRIIGLVLALVVGGLLVGGLLIPSIEGMTATEKTLENEGYLKMTSIAADDTTTYVIEWDVTTPNVMTVNNEPVELNLANAPAGVSVIFDNDWGCRANVTNGAITSISYIPNAGNTTVASSTLVCTLSEGSMTLVADGTTTRTEDYTVAYIPNANGAFVMKNSTTTAYILEDSELIGFGISAVNYAPSGSGQRGIIFDGSIEDGITPNIWRPPTDTTSTITDVEINATQDGKYIGIYKLSNITMVFNHVDEDQTAQTNLTYSYFLVPSSVTAELTQHLDATQIAMFGVISILGIVALVVVAANGIRNKY